MLKRKLLPDKYLLIIYIALLAAGLVAIYGAQTIHEPNEPYFYNHLKLLLIMLAVNFIILVVPDFFNLIDRFMPAILIGTLLLLIAVLIFGISVEGSYAKRWLSIFGIFTIQPSEIAKITLVLYLSSVLTNKGDKLKHVHNGLLPPLIVLVIICLLIMLEPDSGTALLFALVGFSMFFYGGIPLRYLISAGILLGFIFILFILNTPYMKARVISYLTPHTQSQEEMYQINRAKLAFNYGGISGIPDEEIREASTHLPAALTDFIFASIAQRHGFIGNIILLLLFFSFTIRGFIISSSIKDIFLKNISFGINIFISGQAYLNMMVATLMLPTTGMPLPFISYGRNALVINMIMFAILLKITQRREE
ncbi:FtsW/RodA/SpoVE family cell cycle protein [Brachyspira pilosicoli]|uniref:FtsW/RodA/SpoVE family cell cycle protein n=1 Tax=Brachyspira pilosicoli TaxID=52584 RepID=UPI00300568A6